MEDFQPTAEMEAARRRVLRFHFRRYRGKAPAVAKPKQRSGPGALERASKAVLPSPSSKQRRYRECS